jgi:hypothetical protein
MNILTRAMNARPQLLAIALAVFAGNLHAAVAPTVQIGANEVVIRNGLVERAWSRDRFRTTRLKDLRNGRLWTANSADFALTIRRVEIPADLFSIVATPTVQNLPNGGVRVTMKMSPLALPDLAGLRVTRIVEMYPGVAGMRTETFVESPVPLEINGYVLDQSRPAGLGLHASMHSFRAGADWREPEWAGPPLVIGDARAGDWRQSASGATVSGTAQWLSIKDIADRRVFYVLERNDYASSMMGFDGITARALVDLRKDILYLGPFEEQIHIENRGFMGGRLRTIVPGTPLRLEPVFTGVASGADDEPWQHHKYLTQFRMPPYRREVTFNSNGTDHNVISTGAKDDLDYATFLAALPIAQQIGIETFIFDDGWQARSGDWCPDSVSNDAACQEPRGVYPARFPDSSFAAVQSKLQAAGMNLGLWMSPMHFHPSSLAFQRNPVWTCSPVGDALVAYNIADPESSSNEAGIAQWNPEAIGIDGVKNIDYIESRIRVAIDEWGARYFKFDFTAWLDCVGFYPVDIYGYRESFMAMLDRVIADHPDVTIQMDETNDYRLFPFEALARGPTWYQNGSPTPPEALHTNQVLAPYLPTFALGRNALRSGDLAKWPVDYQMAVALLSHITFFNELTTIPAAVRPRIGTWMNYYRAHRDDFAAFTYPLLGEDPLPGTNWAAFQTWDPEKARGALLVYRQDSAETHRVIKLRNVPAGTYRLLEAPAETTVLIYTAEQLRAGISVPIGARNSARVFRIART